MGKTVNVENDFGNKVVAQVVFEGVKKDADNFRFFVACHENVAFKQGCDSYHGLLIAFGDDDHLDPESDYVSSVFALPPGKDLKVKAEQLRELADWFDSQAE